MKPRLFECRYELVYYAVAETEMAAQQFLRQAIIAKSHDTFAVKAHEVWHKDWPLAPGWRPGSFVHENPVEGTMLVDVLAELPAREDGTP